MEDNTIRKVRITTTDILKLLSELEYSGEVTVELGIKDTKSNYSLLSRSPEVQDWDFITAEEKPRQEEKGVINLDENEKGSVKLAEGILKGIEPWDWNGVAWRIESVWRAALKSPAVLFQSDFFWRVIEQVSSFSVTPEHAILVKLSEARWGEWEWEDVNQDLTQILNSEWKKGEIGKKSLTDLSRLIYGNRIK